MQRYCLVLSCLLATACGSVAGEPDATPPSDASHPQDAAPPDGTDLVTLTVVVSGSGAGVVTSDPAGIDCGSTCTLEVSRGTSVDLTASPNGTSAVAGWSGGGCSSGSSCTVDVDADLTVTVTFEPKKYTVTVAVAGAGAVTSDPSGISCGDDCVEEYEVGTMVTLTATPLLGSTFAGWSGGGCSDTGSCQFTVTGEISVSASFQCPSGSATFNYTGGAQTLDRPLCVTSIAVDARGAAGGYSRYNDTLQHGVGGRGGRVQATLAITAADAVTVVVGGVGANGTATTGGAGGFNGGGGGGANIDSSIQTGGGGGGASDVRIGGVAVADRVVVAAGGGGAATCGSGAYNGGPGGGLTGGAPPASCGGTLPTGGTQSAGGTGGSYPNWCDAEDGALATGADGCSPSGAGGAGAGYYGGGGGAWNGGAGGSSYAMDGATEVAHTADFQDGNGQVIISW